MKKLLLIISLMTLFSLLWCGKKEEIKDLDSGINIWNISSEVIKRKTKEESQEKIVYDAKKAELTIWESVLIKKGQALELPEYISIPNKEPFYVNSNVKRYLFYVIDQKVENIAQYYDKTMKNKWFERYIDPLLLEEFKKASKDGNNIKLSEFLSTDNLEYVIKEKSERVEFTEDWKEKIVKEDIITQKVSIRITENIPSNLEYLNLNWSFVEIYY